MENVKENELETEKEVDIEENSSETAEEKDSFEEKTLKLEKEYKDLNDKYLRCLAEYDNFRKRSAKEKDRIFSDAIVFSVKGILDVLDNFERALKCETKDPDMKKGFEMIFNQLLEGLKKLGIEEIQTENETFDPAFHNAVMHIEDESYGQGQIVETLQKGYKIGDSIVRYAMVKVAN